MRRAVEGRLFGLLIVGGGPAGLAARPASPIQADGCCFGAGVPGSVVFCMHASQSFAVGEGAVTYHGDRQALAELRTMVPVTAALAGRVISLPLLNRMTREVARQVVGALRRQLDAASARPARGPVRSGPHAAGHESRMGIGAQRSPGLSS